MLINSEKLTKNEFCRVTYTPENSKLFELLGETGFYMRLPYCDTERSFIWYHASNREETKYFANYEVHEDIKEVWVDSKELGKLLNLEPRKYGYWFVWAKF